MFMITKTPHPCLQGAAYLVEKAPGYGDSIF